MIVEVKFFARYREITGIEAEELETAAADLEGFMLDLFRKYPKLSSEKNMLVAVNEAFADPKAPLNEGDTVAVLPPVSGG